MVLVSTMLSGCGGSGDAGPVDTGVAGIWTASNVPGTTAMLFVSPTSVQPSFSAPLDFFYQTVSANCTGEYSGNLVVPQAGQQLSGSGYFNPSVLLPGAACSMSGAASFDGEFNPGASFLLTADVGTASQPTLEWKADDLYHQPSDLPALAGAWLSADGSVWNIDVTGALTETQVQAPYTGCTVTGQVSIINPAYNLFAFNMSWSDCPSGPEEHGQALEGLLAIDSSVTPYQLLGGGVVNSGSGEVFNVAVQALRQP